MLRRCLPSTCRQLPPHLGRRHNSSAQNAPSKHASGCCVTQSLAMGAETEQALPAAAAPDADQVPWYAKAGRPDHHKVTSSRGFVGQSTLAATEYHDSDFSWHQHAAEVEARAKGSTGSSRAGGLPLLRPQQQGVSLATSSNGLQPSRQAVCGPPRANTASLGPPSPAAPVTQQPASSGSSLQSQCWDDFHASSNSSARFYKERRYLMMEFPCLMQPDQHIFEIGCGCGSSLLPILKANPTSRVTATDLSPTAVRLFCEAAEFAGIDKARYEAFALDAVAADANHLTPTGVDAVLLVFTLAALAPAQMHAMLSCAFQALKPGGHLLVRDHGLYDLTHLRLTPDQEVEPRLFRRLDGTLCYFFTTDDLADQAAMAGFQIEECKYACTELLNRRKGLPMRRVFVHAVLKRPLV